MIVERTTIASLAGGLSAHATGDDFIQGAFYSATAHLANHESAKFHKKHNEFHNRRTLFSTIKTTNGHWGGSGHAPEIDGTFIENPALSKNPIMSAGDKAYRLHDIRFYEGNIEWSMPHSNPTQYKIDQKFVNELDKFGATSLYSNGARVIFGTLKGGHLPSYLSEDYYP